MNEKDVKTKPGFKTDLKDLKDSKTVNLDEVKKLFSCYTGMSTSSSFGFVFIRERYFVMACFNEDYE